MLSKKEIAETIILQKNGGRPSSENSIDYRDVYDVVDMMYAQLAAASVQNQIRGKGDFSIDSVWVKTFSSRQQAPVILFDKITNMCYANLPATRVYIQGDKDIRLVSWLQSQDHPFPMEDSAAQEAMNQLECGVPSTGTYPFFPDGQRLWFRTMPKRFKGKRILVRMIPGIDGYTPEEQLPIPSTFSMDLLNMVAQFFQVQISTLSKNVNDSNVNTK